MLSASKHIKFAFRIHINIRTFINLSRPALLTPNRTFPYSCIQRYQKREHQLKIAKASIDKNNNNIHEKNRDLAIRCEDVTKCGVYANLGLVIIKGSAGMITNSMSLIADAVHSLTDLLSDFMTFCTIRYSQRKPTKRFPLGFGKLDTFGTLPVAALLGFGSYHIICASITKLYATATVITMPYVAMGCVILSLVVKEWLYRITIDAGNKYHSNVTIANAWHHRSDAYSSLIALVGVGGYCCGYPIADPLCGMFVGIYLFKIGIDFGKMGFEQLLDRNSELHWNIAHQIICNECDGVQHLHELIVTRSGQFIHISAEVMVNQWLNMNEIQEIVDNIKVKLHENPALNIQHLAIIPIAHNTDQYTV